MNELEFIRHQVSTERTHMGAVRSACAAALALQDDRQPAAAFLVACAEYLVFIVGRFNAQDQAHCDLLRPRVPAADAREHAVLDDLEQTLAASREALDALGTALRAHQSETIAEATLVAELRTYLSFHANVLAGRRHAIHHLFGVHYGIADWRAASAVDADSILEERERFARVVDLLPDGVVLASRGSEAPAPLPPAAGVAATHDAPRSRPGP